MKKFLCLGYLNMSQFDGIPESEKNEILGKCFAQCETFRAQGKVVLEEGLEHFNLAKVIKPVGGTVQVTDGPFMECQPQIGAIFIVEADSMEEAVAVASLHPGAMFGEEYGFGIEVRPLQ